MNCLPFRLPALLAAAAFAVLLACTPDEQPPAAADAAVPDSGADTAPADASADVGDVAPEDVAGDAAVDSAADASPEVALPQCVSASDCPTPGSCWLSTCTSKGHCALAPAAVGTSCDDGNACTTQDQCGSGLCAGTAKLACDDENACTVDKCNPIAGCLNLPAAASSACDDGDPCTQGDSCQQGQCESGQSVCQCKTNSDCNKFEDGDLCNGTLYCDKAGGSAYTCKVNPASVITCATASNSACQTNTCVASTGQCKLVVAPGNTPCSDGEACTTGDFCESGQCQGGTNTCYCESDADCQAKEDGNLCNGKLFCNKASAQCQVNPASVVTCQTVDETACLKNLCNPKEGKCHLLPLKDGKVCDDGNPCTPNETCSKGECSSAINSCECQKDADCLAKEDGNLCNGTLYCDAATNQCRVNPATVVTCLTGDDPPCLADVCNPKTGKCSEIALPKDGTACDDGTSCTAQSFCQGGQCVGSANLCECQKDGDCAAKEDANLCNGKLFCNPKSNKCEVNPATVVECPGAFDEECLTNQCDPATGSCGMKPAHQGNQCGGKSVCSAGGWCNAGMCETETASACECQKDSDCSKLEDGDLWNGTLYCNKTLPKPQCQLNPASVVVCQTVGDSTCSQAQCQPASGACKMVALTGSCSDGLACTEQDGCSGGACKGSPKACVDSLPCTADSCAEPFGCLHLPTSVSACDDGNACTASDACLGGKCMGTAKTCEDGNPCTTDSCHGEKGC